MVWRSDSDGKLFEDEAKYKAHLRNLATARRAQRKHDAFLKERFDFFAGMRNTCRSPEEIVDFVKANWDKFCENAYYHGAWRYEGKYKKIKNPVLTEMKIDVRWYNTVSNSHSCPLDGVENWAGKKLLPDGTPAPRGYPGWQGSIKWKSESDDPYASSDIFKETCIHTGTGSGGQSAQYECRLYASDWPAMTDWFERARMWQIMTDDKRQVEAAVREMIAEEA
jgi:hypothetical protein